MSDVSINALDNMSSLLWGNDGGGAAKGFSYSPFGSTAGRSAGNAMLPGFNGERLDPLSQSYHLGNGYRTYKPKLMRFNGPDNWSPFGPAGLNQYTYCEGDPINQSDPSGHMSSGAIGGIIGAIVGLGSAILAIATLGSSIAALLAAETITASLSAEALAAGAGVVATGTGIASNLTAKSDPGLSKALGYAALGLGVISFATTAIDHIHSRYLKKNTTDEISRSGRRRGGDLMQGDSSNVRQPINGVLTYEDLGDAGERRLNIEVVGMYSHDGPSDLLTGDFSDKNRRKARMPDTLCDIGVLANDLSKAGIRVDEYDSIHLISNYGANGKIRSSGAMLSLISGKPVTAYFGEVSADSLLPLSKTNDWRYGSTRLSYYQRRVKKGGPGVHYHPVLFKDGHRHLPPDAAELFA